MGDALCDIRQHQGRTLREASPEAQASLDYLSEVGRGQKKASSELFKTITSALCVPLWFVLREVFERMVIIDSAVIPDAASDDIIPVTLISWHMKRSESYGAVEATFGSALGHSCISDLYLASLGVTALDTLSASASPDAV